MLRLRAAISPFGSLLFAGPVVGEITGTRLRARKHIFRNGGFQAHLVADLIDGGGRTFIKCRFTMRHWDFCFFLAWMVVVFAIWVKSPPEASAMILSFIGLGGFGGLSFMLYLARKERLFLIKFLGDAVGAREVEGGVDWERHHQRHPFE